MLRGPTCALTVDADLVLLGGAVGGAATASARIGGQVGAEGLLVAVKADSWPIIATLCNPQETALWNA